MARITMTAVVLALSVVFAGCTRPLLFNNGLFLHTVEPLTINSNPTAVRESLGEARGYIYQAEYPLVTVISVRLGKNALGEVAREHGISTVSYADIERWGAFFGLWSTDVVHIYGR